MTMLLELGILLALLAAAFVVAINVIDYISMGRRRYMQLRTKPNMSIGTTVIHYSNWENPFERRACNLYVIDAVQGDYVAAAGWSRSVEEVYRYYVILTPEEVAEIKKS